MRAHRNAIAGAVVAAACAACCAWAPPARAFCRTTTVRTPPGYDPSQVGACWAQGTPLHWDPQRVPYVISQAASRQVPLADAERVAQLSFSAWNDAPCPGGAPGLVTYFGGTVSTAAAADDCGLVPCDATVHDPQHVIVFDDDSWPYNDPANTIALTTVTFGVDDGVIFDADIEINTHDHVITATEPPPSNAIDLRAVLTHEAGHFYGLAHATDQGAIMYAFYKPGAIQLTHDDVDGVCAAAPPSSPATQHGGCSCATPGAERGVGWAALGAGLTIVALAALRATRRSRRAGRRRSPSPRRRRCAPRSPMIRRALGRRRAG